MTQVGSEIVPGCVFAIAAALVKVTLPNRVSGTGVQRPLGEQFDGASAIHSADETSSGCVSVIVFENRVWRVRFFRLIVTVCPLTSTAALMRSPGADLERDRDGGGRHDLPPRLVGRRVRCSRRRTTLVPSCSSEVEEAALPPSPTQKAAASERPAPQVAFGWIQVPVTSLKVGRGPVGRGGDVARPVGAHLGCGGERSAGQRPATAASAVTTAIEGSQHGLTVLADPEEHR